MTVERLSTLTDDQIQNLQIGDRLVVDASHTITQDVTIPAGVDLRGAGVGLIDAGDFTLTVAASVHSETAPVFTVGGTGSIYKTGVAVRTSWFHEPNRITLAMAAAAVPPQGILIVDSDVTVSADLTLAADLLVEFEQPGRIRTGAFTVTINAARIAGDYQMFDVDGGGGVVLPNHGVSDIMWFGGTGDGSTDDRDAINAAATAASGGRLIFSPGTYRVASALTLAADTTVVGHGGVIKPDDTITVTINGPIEAGHQQVFDCSACTTSGGVTLNNAEANVRWFGASGDGSTDDTTAIQFALDACKKVYASKGTYIFERLVMNTVNRLRGDGPGITILKQDAETVAPGAQGIGVADSATWYEVRDLEIDGNAANQSWYSAASPTAENGHGISICSGADCGGLTVYPEHVEVHNVYAHDMTRNPFLINGDVVNCSNLTAKNSYGDHLFYVSASEHGNFVNIHCRGYWSSGAMALEGVNVTNLTFDDITENPDNPTNTLDHYIGTRSANSLRGTNILNVTAEFDPALSADYFLFSEGAARISQVELDAVSTNTGEFDFFRTGGTVASRVVINGLYARDVYDGFALVATGNTAADLIEFDHVQIEYNAAVIAAVDLCYIECVLDRLAITNLKTYGGDAAELVRLGTVAEVKDLFIENVSMTSVGTYIVVNANDIGRLWVAHCDFDGTAALRGLVSVNGTGDTLDEAMIQDVHITNSSSYGPFSFAAGTVVGPVTCIRLTADATGIAIPDNVSLLDCDITGDSVGKLQVNKSGDAVEMVLDRTDTLSAAATVASLTAKGRDNAGGENDYSEIRFRASTVTADGESGAFEFHVADSGASGVITQILSIDQKGSTASKGGHIDAVQTVTGTSITVDCENGLVVRLDPLTGATTFNTPTNPTDGAVLKFRIQQDGAGGAYGVTFGSVFKLAGGSYTMSTGNDQIDTICFVYDSTDSAWYETSRAQNLS